VPVQHFAAIIFFISFCSNVSSTIQKKLQSILEVLEREIAGIA